MTLASLIFSGRDWFVSVPSLVSRCAQAHADKGERK
jgi:hypothetical protein